jgi:hypothetical protein
VTITTNTNGQSGHTDHDGHVGDIIPAPATGCPAEDPDCDESGLPCSSIPMAPSHRWALFAALVGGGGAFWFGARRRGRGGDA